MSRNAIQQQFDAALDELVATLRQDRSVLAAVLGGSLSHDTVWAKSDIDLVIVTQDEKKPDTKSVALYADGVNIHAWLMTRTEFRQSAEGSIRNSFTHSFLTKSRLLYSHDPTIADLCAGLKDIGERDRQVQLLRAATHALPAIYKARKWLLTRGDLDYTALWMLYAATPLATVEVMTAGLLVDREVIPQALQLNPAFFKVVYTDLLNTKKTRPKVEAALELMETYVADRAPKLFASLIDYFREAQEARACTEIDDYFQRNFAITEAITTCEYLADQGLLGKVSTPLRLTRRSNVAVQELAFFYIDRD